MTPEQLGAVGSFVALLLSAGYNVYQGYRRTRAAEQESKLEREIKAQREELEAREKGVELDQEQETYVIAQLKDLVKELQRQHKLERADWEGRLREATATIRELRASDTAAQRQLADLRRLILTHGLDPDSGEYRKTGADDAE